MNSDSKTEIDSLISAQKRGGQLTWKNHPEIFRAGREKAIALKKKQAATLFDYNQPITEELSEFLGAFAGDGFTNQYNMKGLTQFAGDKRYDTNYYQSCIIPIAKNLFNISKVGYRTHNNAMWVSFYSNLLFEFLTERFRMPAGVKFDKVLIPEEIIHGKLEHKIAFVRGTFDTDGCVFFDKRKTYKEPYMRVDICMYNVPILNQIKQILNEVQIESKVLGNGKHLQITSKENVQRFFEIVGSSNERHRTKIHQKYPDFDEWNPGYIRLIPARRGGGND